MAGLTTRYYSLSGGLNTSYGLGTINSSTRLTESPDTFNVEPYKLSGLKSQEGNKRIGQKLTARVSLGIEYRKGQYKYMMVFTTDGKIWEYNKTTGEFVEVYQFPHATTRCSGCQFNQGVVFSNGVDDLVYYNHGRHELQAGTVSVTIGSATITGAGTNFTEALATGDYIEIENLGTYRIESVESDTEITLSTEVATTELDPTITGLKLWLTPISELNAVYINSDDPTVNNTIRGLALQSYQGRLWIGANDGNLYYSELGLIHGWDVKYGAGAIPPFYNDNSEFTALGIYASYLVIHKQDYSYYIDATGEEANWSIVPYTDHSCDSQQSWVAANNSYFIFSRLNGGIYPFMARTAFINHYLGQEISVKIREDFSLLDSGRYGEIYPVYHPVKKYLMFYMPMLESNGSSICYIYDFISKAWWKRKLPYRRNLDGLSVENPQAVTCAFEFDNNIYIGLQDGRVLREFSSLTFDGDPICFSWKSPWFQYNDGTNYLSTREFRCKISEEYTNNFYVRNRRDGYDEYQERNINNDKDAFEALVWSDDLGEITDTVWDEYDWVEVGFLIKRFPLPNQFFTSQQIEFCGKVKNEAMCLLGFELDRVEKEEVNW